MTNVHFLIICYTAEVKKNYFCFIEQMFHQIIKYTNVSCNHFCTGNSLQVVRCEFCHNKTNCFDTLRDLD